MSTNGDIAHNEKFLELISNDHLRICKLCNAYARNQDDREDLYQEILCQLWRALPGLKSEHYNRTWLYRVALNTAISFVRKDRKRREHTLPYDEEQVKQLPAHDPSTAHVHQSRADLLLQSISLLNVMERAVITLYLEELSYQQIAEVTGLTEANVGVILHRAKKKLSELMKEAV